MRIFKIMIVLMLLASACSKKQPDSGLRIGIIRPSLNHLPLSYALSQNPDLEAELKISFFSSGWELQEAMISNHVDLGIMPFSYAYNAASKGYPLRILSFLERETDAIVAPYGLKSLEELDQKRLGVLKASTLDLLAHDLAKSRGISFDILYFRSPNEMISALSRGDADAICLYEPLISKLGEEFEAIYYFAESDPEHPCCDLVINTKSLTKAKEEQLAGLMHEIEDVIANAPEADLLDFVQSYYGLSETEAVSALAHTTFRMDLDEEGKTFERRMMQSAQDLGYISEIPESTQIYIR